MPARNPYFVLFLILFALAAICIGGLAILLLAVATTMEGRLTAAAFLTAIAGAGFLITLPLHYRRRLAGILGFAALITSTFLISSAYSRTPKGTTPSNAAFQSVFLEEPGYIRYSPANLVPEVDQFTLGSNIITRLDPYVDGPQADRIRNLFQQVYREMRSDPEFLAAGSTMNYAYRNLFGLDWDSGHLYSYIPTETPTPMPVLLFLHGSGGNFKGYMWVLKAIADKTGCAVVAPDFGLGIWDHPQGGATVDRTLDYITAHPSLDETQVFLSGLSNGGLGVTRAALAHPDRWQAVIYFSGVIEGSQMQRLGAALAPKGTPVFMLHGSDDRRIPHQHIEAAAAALTTAGANASLESVPGEDHFLFFSRRDLVEGFAATALSFRGASNERP